MVFFPLILYITQKTSRPLIHLYTSSILINTSRHGHSHTHSQSCSSKSIGWSLTWRHGWQWGGKLPGERGRAETRAIRCTPWPGRKAPRSCSGAASQHTWPDGRPLWMEREIDKEIEREREIERDTERDTERERELSDCLCCMGTSMRWVWSQGKSLGASPSSMSQEKRVRMRPRGVVSKKRMGLRMRRWNSLAARTVHCHTETQMCSNTAPDTT